MEKKVVRLYQNDYKHFISIIRELVNAEKRLEEILSYWKVRKDELAIIKRNKIKQREYIQIISSQCEQLADEAQMLQKLILKKQRELEAFEKRDLGIADEIRQLISEV